MASYSPLGCGRSPASGHVASFYSPVDRRKARDAAVAADTRYSTDLSLELAVICGVGIPDTGGSASARAVANAVVGGACAAVWCAAVWCVVCGVVSV